MLRTRLWMGAILILVACLILWEENPKKPILLAVAISVGYLAIREMNNLLPVAQRPSQALVASMGLCMITLPWWVNSENLGFAWVGTLLIAYLAHSLVEMKKFHGPDQIVVRQSTLIFILVYLGLLPSIWMSLSFLMGVTAEGYSLGTVAFATAVFIPKMGDIGAYFVGKFMTGGMLGRNLMTPNLSPKKTWQGAIGGLFASIGTSLLLQQFGPLVQGGYFGAILLGLVVGIAGMFGDLAESMLKRDLQTKDASQLVPGFGGLLDVLDSMLWAAPIVWIAIRIFGSELHSA
jgi:phosphatidate cytidylyltransferase